MEPEPLHFYDSLLRCLNKAFFTNLKTQDLYLDLAKNTRKLRFKSIKNIYNTLTEGKADEIIYNKQKPTLLSKPVYNHSYTQRTCWRMIEKLITKMAYYFANERGLKDLAPNMLKIIGYIRKATHKINHKATFMHFFAEVIDSLIEENKIIEKKIYSLLIERGYIYSVDEFYKMSRFEGDQDFVYRKLMNQQMKEEQQSDQGDKSVLAQSVSPNNPPPLSISRSRKGFLTSKKLFQSRVNTYNKLQANSKSQPNSSPSLDQNKHIPQREINSSSSIDIEENIERMNKLSHNIHEQADKVMEEFIRNPHFQKFIDHAKANEGKDKKEAKKEPVIKQIINNIRLKHFAANQQLLEINQLEIGSNQTDRKNSRPRVHFEKKQNIKKKVHMRHRPSIATTLNKRFKQTIFKVEGLDDFQDQLKKNLAKLNTINFRQFDDINLGRNPNNLIRHERRQQTQTIEATLAPIEHQKLHRRSSNINFLSNTFVFSNSDKPSDFPFSHKKTHVLISAQHGPSDSTFKSLDTVLSNRNFDSCQGLLNKNRQNVESKAIFNNQKLNKCTRLGPEPRTHSKEPSRFKSRILFKTSFLNLAAKKYNRYSTDEHYLPEHLGTLEGEGTRSRTLDMEVEMKVAARREAVYWHDKRYEVLDRKLNRIL